MQVELADPELGVLELGCDPYVVVSLQIGSPAVRAVSRSRALADGTFDESTYTGARAVTLTLRLATGGSCAPGQDMQSLIDAVTPYMSPRRRPTLTYQLPGAEGSRSMTLRGESWPFTLAGPKHPGLGLQWVCPTGEIYAGGDDAEHCETIIPASDVEAGRLYNENYADGGRGPYPPSAPLGGRIIINPGNAPAHWEATIFGLVTNPSLMINGTAMTFDRNGGLHLAGGSSVVVNTRERTILLNGDPDDSRYDRVNYGEWAWSQLLLVPGRNEVRFDADVLSPQATIVLCYTPTYLG
jgi:hypothetical protein